jgi:hypothetical protein
VGGEVPGVAVDGNGNAAIAYGVGGEVRAQRFDGQPPEIAPVAVPPSGFAGQVLGFGAVASDTLSGVDSVSWAFGDGSTATGAAATHAYTSAGAFGPTVTVTDAAGNSATASGATSIAALPSGSSRAAPGPPGPPAAEPLGVALGRLPARLKRRALLRRGVRVTIEPDRASAITAELLGTLSGARGARAGDLVLAERALARASGRRSLVLKVARRLRGTVRRGARLRVRVTAVDAQGVRATATRSLRVR